MSGWPGDPGAASQHARMLMVTELSAVHSAAVARSARRDGTLVRRRVGPGHGKSDECDGLAGVYRPEDVPKPPTHPRCLCILDQLSEEESARETRRGMGDLPRTSALYEDLTKMPSSASPYVVSDGKGGWMFTAERQALHDKIVLDAVKNVPASKKLTIHNLGGGPASGKSTMLRSGKLDVPEGGIGAVEVNPDLVKEQLPEYIARHAAKDPAAARFAHEESSYVAKRIQSAAIERNQDILIDGVGTNYQRTLDLAKPLGYEVRGHYAYLPDVDVAVTRAVARGEKIGRFVPEDYIRGKHAEVAQKFPDAASKMNSIELYDTTNGAKLVARAENGVLTVVDQDAYEHFLRIGRGEA